MWLGGVVADRRSLVGPGDQRAADGADQRGYAIAGRPGVSRVEQRRGDHRGSVSEPCDLPVGKRVDVQASTADLAHEPHPGDIAPHGESVDAFSAVAWTGQIREPHLARLVQHADAVHKEVNGAARGADGQIVPASVIPMARRVACDARSGFVPHGQRQSSGADGDGHALASIDAGREDRAMLSAAAQAESRMDAARIRQGDAIGIPGGEPVRGEDDIRLGRRGMLGDADGVPIHGVDEERIAGNGIG